MKITLMIILLSITIVPFLLLTIFIVIKKRGHKNFDKKLIDIKNNSPYRNNNIANKPKNEFLFLEKEEKKEDNIEKLQISDDQKKAKIIGIAKEKGFWSKLIMSQKLGYIMNSFSAKNSKKGGFWVNLINAQSRSEDKHKGRRR
ncbi:MAG: hypothetical protein ACI8ZF_000152 [Candidatus Midichloriaceae bacterium]|jgi:hypothetical protein